MERANIKMICDIYDTYQLALEDYNTENLIREYKLGECVYRTSIDLFVRSDGYTLQTGGVVTRRGRGLSFKNKTGVAFIRTRD